MITSIFYEKNKLNCYKLMPHLSLFGINNTFTYNKLVIEKNQIFLESINNNLIIKEEINKYSNSLYNKKEDEIDDSYVFIDKPKE